MPEKMPSENADGAENQQERMSPAEIVSKEMITISELHDAAKDILKDQYNETKVSAILSGKEVLLSDKFDNEEFQEKFVTRALERRKEKQS